MWKHCGFNQYAQGFTTSVRSDELNQLSVIDVITSQQTPVISWYKLVYKPDYITIVIFTINHRFQPLLRQLSYISRGPHIVLNMLALGSTPATQGGSSPSRSPQDLPAQEGSAGIGPLHQKRGIYKTTHHGDTHMPHLWHIQLYLSLQIAKCIQMIPNVGI